MRLLIVDDEQECIAVLVKLAARFDHMQVVATATSASEAIQLVVHDGHKIDVALLDIVLADQNGMVLAKMLMEHAGIVFTTAHPEYGVASYQVNAIDYLLKPIGMDDFKRSMSKAQNWLSLRGKDTYSAERYMDVKREGLWMRLLKDDIVYLESRLNYVHFFTAEDQYELYSGLKDLLQNQLNYKNFVQVHKSFAINLNFFKSINKNVAVMKNGAEVSIGRLFKKDLLEIIRLRL